MFTGIVQAIGTVAKLTDRRLLVGVPNAWPGEAWVVGESVAVDGCCLTIVSVEQNERSATMSFDLSEETLGRTTLGSLKTADAVNIERAMRASDRLGGHIVQGHVDTVGTLASRGEGVFVFEVGREWRQYLVDKGSVAVDGISLTVVQPDGGRFSVAVVPHTLEMTTLNDAKAGDEVNVEFDVIAKYAVGSR